MSADALAAPLSSVGPTASQSASRPAAPAPQGSRTAQQSRAKARAAVEQPVGQPPSLLVDWARRPPAAERMPGSAAECMRSSPEVVAPVRRCRSLGDHRNAGPRRVVCGRLPRQTTHDLGSWNLRVAGEGTRIGRGETGKDAGRTREPNGPHLEALRRQNLDLGRLSGG